MADGQAGVVGFAEEFPPRGGGNPRVGKGPSAEWGHPWELGTSWDYAPGKILLGEWDGRVLARADERHIVTVAGSRAGKSYTVLKPNLRMYPGSMIVLDPKGELARDTAADRRAMGQTVHVLDPFGVSGETSSSHNPLEELRHSAQPVADAAQIADALIIGNEKDPYWTDSARQLIQGIILHLLDRPIVPLSLDGLVKLLHLKFGGFESLFDEMSQSTAFDGRVANIGASFLGLVQNTETTFQSVLSTAQSQTSPLFDVGNITARSDFRLEDLKKSPMTLYLVLPGMRIGTHFRWLRVVIQQAMAKMEETPGTPDHAVLFMLEEFAALGHMRSIETAAGFMAGFGVKLWTVLQDFSQLKTQYPKSWETFLGNAGILQAFGNVDLTTTEYLSKLLGQTLIHESHDVHASAAAMASGDLGRREQLRHVPLLDPSEITRGFAKETWRQMILIPGRPPIYMDRFFKPERQG